MESSRIVSDGKPMDASELMDSLSTLEGATSCATSVAKQLSAQAPVKRDDEQYNMANTRRGKAIIFNHENYDLPNIKKRTGTQTDKIMLRKVLHEFGFQVDVHDDLTSDEILNKLEDEKNLEELYRDSDCLVVAVMTHGEEDGMIYARDEAYHVEVLWNAFMAHKFPSLAGKPKIFLIQACRGHTASESHQFEKAKVQTDGLMEPENVMRYSIPTEADMLIVYSTFPGKVSYRDTEDGAWFIQEFCTELLETGKSDDFLSILTKVNRRVALNYEYKTYKQMPMIQSTLTRKILFGEKSRIARDDGNLFSEGKLDIIIDMLKDLRVHEPRRAVNKPRPHLEWENLKLPGATFDITQTDAQIVKVAMALKLFLTEKKQVITLGVRDEGITLLNLLSVWGSLAQDQRCFAYRKLDNFLKTHGKDWEYLKMVNLPQIGAEKHRRFSYSSSTPNSSFSKFPTDGYRSIDRRNVKKQNN